MRKWRRTCIISTLLWLHLRQMLRNVCFGNRTTGDTFDAPGRTKRLITFCNAERSDDWFHRATSANQIQVFTKVMFRANGNLRVKFKKQQFPFIMQL